MEDSMLWLKDQWALIWEARGSLAKILLPCCFGWSLWCVLCCIIGFFSQRAFNAMVKLSWYPLFTTVLCLATWFRPGNLVRGLRLILFRNVKLAQNTGPDA